MKRAATILACLASLGATPAGAHAVLDRQEATPQSSYRGAMRIGHGCEGQPTTSLRIEIPEGVIGAKAMPKPGWTLTTEKGPYARAYKSWHGEVSSGVKAIVWSKGELPDDQFDEFVFSAQISDALAPGATLYFPTIQQCAKGEHRWVETPAGDGKALRAPAPALRIVAKAGAPMATPMATPATAPQAELAVEAPWLRPAAAGAVAGGFFTLRNDGPADRLVGARADFADRVEIHESTMKDGVAQMRERKDGVAAPDNARVEFRPGGFHLMIMGLKTPLVEGETRPVTLLFEKAGPRVAPFSVRRQPAADGASGSGAGDGGHHKH